MDCRFRPIFLLNLLCMFTMGTAQITSSQSCNTYDTQCLLDFITDKNDREMEILRQIRNDMRDEIVDEIADEIARIRITCNNGPSDLSNCPVGEENIRPRNCWELRQAGSAQDGIYTIYPYKHEPIEVYCDMYTSGGGWIVFQRRQDGSVDFNRTWNEYRDGFGDLEEEHWLGNKHIHAITRYERNELRVELGDWDDETRYCQYDEFSLDSEESKFKLNIGIYSGSAGNSLAHHVWYFSTFDMDNDNDAGKHFASKYSSGFWFTIHNWYANLNAPYRFSSQVDKAFFGIIWRNWRGTSYSLKTTEMKMRPRSRF